MSSFFIGTFIGSNIIKNDLNKVKEFAKSKDTFVWIDEEIHSCEAFEYVIELLDEIEDKDTVSPHKFFLTTKLQFTNSSDLLLPFDKYDINDKPSTEEGLKVFRGLCKRNLSTLYEILRYFIDHIEMSGLRIAITDGNDEFVTKRGSIDTIIGEIEEMVYEEFSVNSIIYDVILN